MADYAQYLGQLAEKWGVAADVERYRNIISKFDDVAPTASTIPASRGPRPLTQCGTEHDCD